MENIINKSEYAVNCKPAILDMVREKLANKNMGHYERIAETRRMTYAIRHEYYSIIMTKLRNLGYSNADIAKKTGFCYMTVFKYIGAQPDETTLASMRTAGAKRRFRNIAVKNQAARDAGKPIPSVAEIIKEAV